jgi:hypothetical protein
VTAFWPDGARLAWHVEDNPTFLQQIGLAAR